MAKGIYFFNGKDITMNVVIQIKCVLNVLQRRMNISFPDAALKFYRNLQNTSADRKRFVGRISRIYCRQVL